MDRQRHETPARAESFSQWALGIAALAVAAGFVSALFQPAAFDPRIAGLATAAGALFTGFGVFYAAQQLRLTRKIARGDFLLHVDELLLTHHREAYENFRPGGPWAEGVLDDRAMNQVVLYAGLFERIKTHMDSGIADKETIHQLYSYRVKELLRNPSVRHYILNDHRSGWTQFIALCESLKQIDGRQGKADQWPSLAAEDNRKPPMPAAKAGT